MDVETNREVKDYTTYETSKWKFRISDDKLEKMKEKDNFESKIRKRVMKNLRLKENTSTGQEWEDSVNAIVEELIK